jgi:di/tricarboxylate transporter
MDIAIVLIIVAVAVVLFATEKLSMDVVAILVLGSLTVFGLVKPGEALSGFGHEATVTVGAMFVLSAGLNATGALGTLGQRLIQHGKNETMLLLLVMVGAALVSPFINNTAAVAVFLPLVIGAAATRKIANSKLLIPLSFASQFGGVCTLIGSSTNLIVSAASESHGYEPFGMFEFTKLGLIMVGAGLAYFLILGRWLLPERQTGELVEAYSLGEYITELRVLPNSNLIGRSVLEARLGQDHDVRVMEILRGELKIWAPLHEPLHAGDILLVRGRVKDLFKLKNSLGLVIEPEFKLKDEGLARRDIDLVETLVAPRSTLLGRTLKGLDFHWRYNAIVLAIHRRGQLLRNKLASVRFKVGDALLLLAPRGVITKLRGDPGFVVLEPRRDVALDRQRAPLALGIVGAVVLIGASDIPGLHISIAALLGCGVMLTTRCVRGEDAYRAVDWKIIILLACLIPLGLAIENTGTADLLVDRIMQAWHGAGPQMMLAVIYLLTFVLSAFLSNNATAVLMAPLAIVTAEQLEVNPRPFLMAVTFAASTCFATPVGYQTNAMVYHPGGYRFTDFAKVGLPLNFIFFGLAVYYIPKFWPF